MRHLTTVSELSQVPAGFPPRRAWRPGVKVWLETVVVLLWGMQAPLRASAGSSAAEARDELADIDLLSMEVPVLVTVGRRVQEAWEIPGAVSVITAADIRASGARSVPDALRLVPGVDVGDLSYNVYAVAPRGMHGVLPRESLVLVDGRQLFDSMYGATLWGGWPFQLEDIERIEVVRGPAGVTWGANAVNGLINIVTRDPRDQQGLTLTGMGASRGTSREHLGYGFSDGRLRMRISGEHEGSDGFLKGGSFLRSNDDELQQGKFGVHAVYEAAPDDTLTLSAGHSIADGGFPTAPLATFLKRLDADAIATYVMSRWEHRIDADASFFLSAYFNDYYECPAAPMINYRYQQYALQLGHVFKPTDAHTVTWGIDSRADALNASFADPQMLSKDRVGTGIVGLYVQDDWEFAPRWSLSLGGRIDYEFYGGFEPSGRAALSYELTETSRLYASVARAFQMPPVGTRFVDFPVADGLAWYSSARDVDSEHLIAYEIGYRAKYFGRLETNLSVYAHQYQDLTAQVRSLGPPGLLHYHFRNAYDATSYGVELDARYRATDRLTLLGHYTFQRLEDDGDYLVDQTDTLAPPAHKFMVGARYSPLDDLHLSAHLYYVDDTTGPDPTIPLLTRRIGAYFRLDLRAEYEFWEDRASVAVGVRNLLDGHHLEATTLFQNVAEVPRMVYAEIRMRLE